MISLFSTTDANRGGLIDLNVTRLKRLQESNLDKYSDFYHSAFYKISLTSPIYRLCYRLQYDVKTAIDAYNRADVEMDEICTPLGLTTEFNTGKVYEGLFYGEDVKNIFIVESNSDHLSTLMSSISWRTRKPIRVLAKPGFSDSHVRPDHMEYFSGYSVMAIDVPYLAWMLWNWQQANSQLPQEERESLEHFVSMYVYPSLTPSQADVSIINALGVTYDSLDSDYKISAKEPLYTVDNSDDFYKAIHNMFDKNKAEDFTWEQYLKQIASFRGGNLLDVLPVFHTRRTVANEWVMLAALMPWVTVLAERTPRNPLRTGIVTKWRRLKRRIKGQRVISKCPDIEVRELLEEQYTYLDELMSKY